MTDEELDARLQRIENRLSNIEQMLGRIEQDRAQTQKEKHTAKRQYKGRRKSYPHSSENKTPTGPKFKRDKSYPRTLEAIQRANFWQETAFLPNLYFDSA